MAGGHDRFARAIAAIDAENANDPNTIVVGGTARPKELAHAELVTAWVRRLRPDASEALLLAARGHHVRRWELPRASYPAGRAGYLRWRHELHDRHADTLARVLRTVGYDDATIERVQAIVRKDGLHKDPDVQTFEDALCLVFLTTQLGDIRRRLDGQKLLDVLVKTVRKMSAEARAAAAELALDDEDRRLLEVALAQLADTDRAHAQQRRMSQRASTVKRYLVALRTRDWDALAETLHPDVVRYGPYRDFVRGRAAYRDFLAETISSLPGYELIITRVLPTPEGAVVELCETIDDPEGRLRTDEAIVIDVDDDNLIWRVAVYLQRSHVRATNHSTG